MSKWLLDPAIFNRVIMVLYALNVVRWGLAGKWWDAGYWACALGLVLIVTFGYKH